MFMALATSLVVWNGNGNAYDRGDYNSSFALRAVELKMKNANALPVTTEVP